MSAAKQTQLSLLLVLALGLLTVGLVGVSQSDNEEPQPHIVKLDLPKPAESSKPAVPVYGNVYEPEFHWVEPVAEPVGI